MSSLSDILTTMQNGVTAVNALTTATAQSVPASTSGQLAADKLVQIGFVRVLGVSIVAGGAVGGLYDAASVALATSGTQVYVTDTVEGFFPMNMIFKDGLVYKPGAAQAVVIFYTRF
jgi:hypothetical protein